MEDMIKELDEEENRRFGEAGEVQKGQTQEIDDVFNDEIGLKRFEILKEGKKIKKVINKIVILKNSLFI